MSSWEENRTAAGDTHEDTRVGITAMENGICEWAMSKKVENYKAPPAGGLKREKTRWSFSNERKVGGWRNFDRTKNKIRCMERMKLTANPSTISYLIISLVRIELFCVDLQTCIYSWAGYHCSLSSACRFYSTLRELSPPVFVLLFSVHSNNRSSSLNSRGLRSIQYINKESKLLLFLRRYLIKLGTKNHEAELRQILSTKGVVGEKI